MRAAMKGGPAEVDETPDREPPSRPPPARRSGSSSRLVDSPVRIAVCGAGTESGALNALAERVGHEIAAAGAALVCGGLAGVMAAAARGAAQAGGLTIGVLPGRTATDANPWIMLPLPTAMGEGRNVLVVRFADAVIAIGGEWGTLSEVALAQKIGVPVVLLAPTYAQLGLVEAKSPEDAVRLALASATRTATP